MEKYYWLIPSPIIVLMTLMFYVNERGEFGALNNHWVREQVYPETRTISGFLTNWKFQIRGPEPPKNKIVIVEIDSESIEVLGRWPWHRNYMAFLIDEIFKAGAKVVGLDMVFSEPDERIPPELKEVLESQNLGALIPEFETDLQLKETIGANSDKLVLGWSSDSVCQPRYGGKDRCKVDDPDFVKKLSGFEKFSIKDFRPSPSFNVQNTNIQTLTAIIKNIPLYEEVGSHAGTFNANVDPDGVIRKSTLALLAGGAVYPALGLEMARVGLNEDISLSINSDGSVGYVGLKKSDKLIPTTPLGMMNINFRGGADSFPYVSAIDLMGDEQEIRIWPLREKSVKNIKFDCPTCADKKNDFNQSFQTAQRNDLFKDAYVLIGVSALGVYDIRSFPFDENVPGVEGHANILDNILSGDMIKSSSTSGLTFLVYVLLTIGGVVLSITTSRLGAVPSLLFFVGIFGLIFGIDNFVLFRKNIDLDSVWIYLSYISVFSINSIVHYIHEERSKKFLRGAFAKYVAPAVVDSIVKDPTTLSLGGDRRELTIMFSDIRSFTTMSEKMDAKVLAQFLNDYLGKMTELVFEYDGTLDKFIGDAVMSFWGAPLPLADHAYNACISTIQMQKKLAEDRPYYLKEYGIDVRVGIGLNTGIVSVGNMGSEDNFNYTVIGDDVNLAARLEGLTKEYGVGIIATRATINQIEESGKEVPDIRVIDYVKVKGKAKSVEIVEVCDREYDKAGLAKFEASRQLYLQQRWDEAISGFLEASEMLRQESDSADGPSERFIRISKWFKENPPNADWDGSWTMTSK